MDNKIEIIVGILLCLFIWVVIKSFIWPKDCSASIEMNRLVSMFSGIEQKITMCSSVETLLRQHYNWDDYNKWSSWYTEDRDWLVQILTDNDCYTLLHTYKIK